MQAHFVSLVIYIGPGRGLISIGVLRQMAEDARLLLHSSDYFSQAFQKNGESIGGFSGDP